jgi:hypothetical protein
LEIAQHNQDRVQMNFLGKHLFDFYTVLSPK